MSCYTDLLSKSMMFIHQTVFKMKGKLSGPRKIGHSDIQIFGGHMSGHTDS